MEVAIFFIIVIFIFVGYFYYKDSQAKKVKKYVSMTVEAIISIPIVRYDLLNQLKSKIPANEPVFDAFKERLRIVSMATLLKDSEAYSEVMSQLCGIDKNEAEQNIRNLWMEIFGEGFIKDDMISDIAIETIANKGIELGCNDYSQEMDVEDKYEYYLTNWKIINDKIPPQDADVILKKNEYCIYKTDEVDLYEDKIVTKRINYAGPRMRVKIMKGFSYNIGSYNVSTQKEHINTFIDKGFINITDKRIYFQGTFKSLALPINKITTIIPYKDCVKIFKDTGKPILLCTEDAVKLYQFIHGMIVKYQSN